MKHLFKPGESGNPSGRPKGSKNKVRPDVQEVCHKLGCDPFAILIHIAMGNYDSLKLTEEQIKYFSVKYRLEAASELAKYLAPTLRAIEVSSDPENPVNITIKLADGHQLSSNQDSE